MHVDYETFAAMSPLRKNAILASLTPENKAELVVTHLRRFLDSNRDKLNAEQIRFAEESIEYVKPELYRPGSRDEAAASKNAEIEKRVRELFPRELLVQFHFEVFKNSGPIDNPIARALVQTSPRVEEREVELLRSALHDLATLGEAELRGKKYDGLDLAAILGRAWASVPSGEAFWTALSDDDVRLAASRSWTILGSKAIRDRFRDTEP